MHAYVGCYTSADRGGRGDGIVVYGVHPSTGAWEQRQILTGVINPSFLAIGPRQRNLYCVHGGSEARVSAFALDASTGELSYLNSQPSGGVNPVHLSVHPAEKFLVVANYSGGTVAVLPIESQGTLAQSTDVVPLTGEPGPDPVEQSGPHPHDIPFDPAGRFVVVPDKGLDRVFVFGLDTTSGRLKPACPESVAARPGAGPRHAAFHPSAACVYVVNELDSTITTYRYAAESGALQPVQVVTTLPAEFSRNSTGAEIAVTPSGRFVYVSNRGHDSIAIFAVDAGTCELDLVSWEPTRGRMPRHFAIDPSGRFLYAANQASDCITTFHIDQTSGRLEFTGQVVRTGSPVSIAFAADSFP